MSGVSVAVQCKKHKIAKEFMKELINYCADEDISVDSIIDTEAKPSEWQKYLKEVKDGLDFKVTIPYIVYGRDSKESALHVTYSDWVIAVDKVASNWVVTDISYFDRVGLTIKRCPISVVTLYDGVYVFQNKVNDWFSSKLNKNNGELLNAILRNAKDVEGKLNKFYESRMSSAYLVVVPEYILIKDVETGDISDDFKCIAPKQGIELYMIKYDEDDNCFKPVLGEVKYFDTDQNCDTIIFAKFGDSILRLHGSDAGYKYYAYAVDAEVRINEMNRLYCAK
jgi:hypothetical protein